MKTISFNLIENAQDSLKQAVQLLAWKETGDDHSYLKHSITNIAHAVELLLKERLQRINPAFIWEDVDKYPSLAARTVTVDTAISRLSKIAGIFLSCQDTENLRSLRKTRNAIEHYAWTASIPETRTIVATALSFASDFGKRELDIDLASLFKSDHTWRALIDEFYEFSREYGARIEHWLRNKGGHPVCCDYCGNLTVSMYGGSCELCGHWHEPD